HGFYLFEIIGLRITKRVFSSCYTGRTDHIYKSFGYRIYKFNTLLGGLWGYQKNVNQVVFFKYLLIFLVVYINWQIRYNQTVYANFLTFLTKFLHAVL